MSLFYHKLPEIPKAAFTSFTSRESGENIGQVFYSMEFHLQISLSNKMSKEITRIPKIYFFDIGIRNILLSNFSNLDLRIDRGSLLENVVFKYFSGTQSLDDIKFRRKKAGAEIDFVINDKAYEVKYSLGTLKTQQLQSFRVSQPGIDLSVLFYSGETSRTDYHYIPKFLLR